MCGIAGTVGLKSDLTNSTSINLARNLSHRGPDDEGVAVITPRGNRSRNVLFVHRRLSIIDLSDLAHQPMKDESTGNYIIYNGEIYNFKSLRSRLVVKGVNFRSHSDTEVILKSYGLWGVNCLDYLCGMFAFAIWDEQKQHLFIARDRLGIKPLYYFNDDNGLFIFASELRAILNTGLVPRKIDRSGLESYLAFGAVQAPLTIIKGIHSLMPAHYMMIGTDGTVKSQCCYWQAPFSASNEVPLDERGTIQELRGILEEIVSDHLVSDVPVGSFLSGGIDSSSIVALMSQAAPDKLNTFSVTFAEDEYSEAPYSRMIADKYSRNHTEICLTGEQLLSQLPSALAAMDQPTIDGINVYVISKMVREKGIKVVLSGQGADEIFGGYPSFSRINKINQYKLMFKLLPRLVRKKFAGMLGQIYGNDIAADDKIADVLQTDGSVFPVYRILRQLFSSDFRKEILSDNESCDLVNGIPEEVAFNLRNRIKNLDPVNQVSLLELDTYLANMLLRDGDFMSMAHGLEIRVPFLDHRLVEFVAKIPGRCKLSRKLPKPLLLKAMGNLLPSSIYLRPKSGFTFPWEHWLRNQCQSQLSKIFDASNVGANIGFNPYICHSLWRAFLNNEQNITWSRIWGLYVIINWCDRYEVSL